MATPNNLYDNQIVLRIGGMEHRTWQSYDIDSDFLIPADNTCEHRFAVNHHFAALPC